MSNVLSEQAKQQVIALGRLGWSLRRIQQETGVRRETASIYLKAAGMAVQPRGRPGRQETSAKPAISVATDLLAKPAISVATDSGTPGPCAAAMGASASLCEPFRAAIELGLRQGRNAMGIWQDLVSQSGFSGRYGTVKRFVRKLRGLQTPEACAVITPDPVFLFCLLPALENPLGAGQGYAGAQSSRTPALRSCVRDSSGGRPSSSLPALCCIADRRPC